ncbi:MAG: hypothetical protein RDU14_17475 [Melioribacteraceae bacterium]|nr:hypothetical protein [Melioribacteraceae bacterium]
MSWDAPIGYSTHFNFPKYALGANPGADALNENLIEAIDAAIHLNSRNVLLASNNNFTGSNNFTQTIVGSISGSAEKIAIDLDDDTDSDTTYRILLSSTAIGKGSVKVGGDAFFNPFSGRLLLQNLTVTNIIVGSINGNAATVTGGVYVTGNQTIAGIKTFTSTIVGNINGNAATATIATNAVKVQTDIDSDTIGNLYVPFTSTANNYASLKVESDFVYNPYQARLSLQNLTVANTISGSISGNSATVTNGLYSTGSYSNPSWLISLAWSKISSKPTTLAGYGITDGLSTSRTLTINSISYDLSLDRSWSVGDLLSSGSYNNPSWLTGLAWSKISSKPTTLSGYGITDGVIWRGESISDPSSPGSGSLYYNSVSDVFKIYTEGEGNWLTFLFAERSYSNPSWLTSLSWSKLTSIPNAGADGSTKGVASFNGSDFDAFNGNISIDWTNTYSGYLSGITSSVQSQLNGKVSASANNTFSGNNQFNGDIKISDDFVREPKSVTPQILSGSDYYIDCRGKNDVEIDAAGDRTIINISEEGVIDGTYLTIFNMSSSYDLIFERGDNLVLPGISITLGNKYDNITFRYEQTGNYWICVSYITGNAV